MIWFIVSVAAAVLVYLLIQTMRQYEKESAVAALEQIAELTEVTMTLEKRIENLEAIVTAVDSEPADTDVPRGSEVSREVRPTRSRS